MDKNVFEWCFLNISLAALIDGRRLLILQNKKFTQKVYSDFLYRRPPKNMKLENQYQPAGKWKVSVLWLLYQWQNQFDSLKQ